MISLFTDCGWVRYRKVEDKMGGSNKEIAEIQGDYFKDLKVKKKDFGSVKYKVSNDNYLKALNYVSGIRGLEKMGDEVMPTFIGIEGAIYFIKFPHSDKGYIVRDNIKFSEDDKLNKRLIEGLEKRLKN
jgi:hypothetical protein